MVTFITNQKGRIPLWLEALNGNSSDKTSFPESVDAHCKHLKEAESPCFVLDSAAYTADNIANWSSEKRWITRVPETITEAQTALRSVATDEMISLGNGYAIQPTSSKYGGIKQRWLIVHSEQFEQREKRHLDKRVAQATTQVEKTLKN